MPLNKAAFFYLQKRKGAIKINTTLYSFLNTIKHYDFNTYLHCQRVAQVSLYTGKCIGLNSVELKNLWYTALLHDLGKVQIPKTLLFKKERLTEKEWEIIRQHPENGSKLIKHERIASKEIIDGIISHHERYSGTGYPNGLKGELIPLFGRVISIADAFDAMINQRPYRVTPLSIDEAMSEIRINAGVQFDPFIVKEILSQQEQLYVVLLGLRRRIS